jgi:AbrB family looped-hinge helix DNA binding protein
MNEEKEKKSNASSGQNSNCCQIESIVTVDERGQMVLPKEIREKAGIKSGDKLAVVGWQKEGKICCLSLIKAEDFAGMVKGLLSPIMKDIL